ncbi:MAG: choice-of-anchor J domain-containing protein [Muribaculaceae bacterium]|nr:choice-of-anchor J domain-containing protein [Muribaculaceae bacterium]
MKKSLLYIAAAALSSVALGACDDDMALPPIAEPESEWVGMENTTVEQVKTDYWQDVNNYNTPVNLNENEEEIILKGRVISSDATGNIYNNLVVLGEDGYAMTIAARTESSSKKLADQYPFGSEVYLNLSGLSVGRYAGLFQVGAPSGTEITFLTNAVLVEHLQANSIGYPSSVEPLVVDIATLTEAKNSTEGLRKYMSQLIRIDGVTFQNAGKPFAATATENQYVTDAAGARINVRCSNRATWHNDIIPGGAGSVVGILSYFNNDWQILMNDAATDLIDFDPSAIPGPAPEVDPEGDGTAASPYNVAAALKVIAAGPASTEVYVKGIITNLSIDTSYGNATYDLVDVIGGESVKAYRGYWFNGDRFTATDQMQNGKEVVVCGVLENYMGNTPEIKQGNKVVSYDGKTSDDSSTDPTPDPTPSDAIYSETFQGGTLGDFTVENKISNDYSGWYAKTSNPACAIANSYTNSVNLEAESWLISPEIDLAGCTGISMSFKQGFGFDFPTEQDEFYVVKVQADGGDWTDLTCTVFPEKGSGNWTSMGENKFDFDAYAGKKIRVAFVYKNDGTKSRAWEIQDFLVTASK